METIEEFLNQKAIENGFEAENSKHFEFWIDCADLTWKQQSDKLQEWANEYSILKAKHYVQSAIEAVIENVGIHYPMENDYRECIDYSSISTAYDLNQIK